MSSNPHWMPGRASTSPPGDMQVPERHGERKIAHPQRSGTVYTEFPVRCRYAGMSTGYKSGMDILTISHNQHLLEHIHMHCGSS